MDMYNYDNRPRCNILRILITVKMIFLYLLKTKIVDTRKNRLHEAVLTYNHNLCLRAKIRKKCIPL